jgi:hypothetical protein
LSYLLNGIKGYTVIVNCVVIGSGPSSYAAILGLLEINIIPTVIDIGLESRFENSKLKDTSINILGKKKLFGSDHMYFYPTESLNLDLNFDQNVNFHLTGALGGMSTVWGSGLQPVNFSENSNIPEKTKKEFQDAQIAILKKIHHTFCSDDLNEKYPWPEENIPDQIFPTSRFFERALSKYSRRKNQVRPLLIGRPRLAVKKIGSTGGCVLCGKCLNGCPEGSIFNSGEEIKKLVQQNRIKYINGTVKQLVLQKNGATEIFFDSEEVEKSVMAEYLFLGLGPIATPALLLKSRLINRPLTIRDNQVFYLLFLKKFNILIRQKFALAQLVVTNMTKTNDLADEQNEEFNLSLFEYSMDWQPRLEIILKQIGLNNLIFRSIGSLMLRCFVSGIGFITTNDSGSFLMERTEKNRIKISVDKNIQTKSNITRRVKRIKTKLKLIGLYLMPFDLNKEPIVGAGWHLGSALPMGSCREINWNSQLVEAKNVFIIDATSLPEINPGSHTFTAMVNAYRSALLIQSQ